jgi:hypothetical protein
MAPYTPPSSAKNALLDSTHRNRRVRSSTLVPPDPLFILHNRDGEIHARIAVGRAGTPVLRGRLAYIIPDTDQKARPS